MSNSQLKFALGSLVALVLVGCNTDPLAAPTMPTGQVDNKVKDLYIPEAEAGVKLGEDTVYKDMPTVWDIAKRRSWGSRQSNAFSLLAAERKFDQEQSLERLLNEGGFLTEYEVPDETSAADQAPQTSPTPAWRLAGIVVSEGAVIALLDQGSAVDTVVPGQFVAGTEWQCVAIDLEKAVFRRDPRRIPSQIVVPLQGTLPGQFGSGGGGGAGAGGGDDEGGGGNRRGGGGGRGTPGGADGSDK